MGRARRSFLFSIGLLLVGFLAVGAGIVYKSTQVPDPPAASGADYALAAVKLPSGADYALAAVKLPSGAEIVSAVAADGRVSVTYRNGATTSIRIFDGRTGEILREIPVVSE